MVTGLFVAEQIPKVPTMLAFVAPSRHRHPTARHRLQRSVPRQSSQSLGPSLYFRRAKMWSRGRGEIE
jgi:hypothetical protein